MGRITINGTQAGFSCKKEVSLALWDVKTNRAKGKSEEARTLNQELDNIKAQITRHYQYICDHDSFVTAKKVYNRYVGFSEECHTLMNLFREQLEPYKKKIGIEKAESTYCGLVADYKSLLLFMKSKKNAEDIVIEELEKSFIEDYYNWMLGTCALANSTVFGRVNTLKWLMYIAQEKGWIRVHPFASFECMPEYKRRSFLSEEELQRIIHIEPRYKRQRAMRDMFLFMCFTNAMRLSLGIIGRKCNSGARSPRTSDATHLPFWPYSRGCCWKLFRKCLGISPSHTSCASIHLSGAGGAIFFWKSPICTTSVLTSFLNS